MFKKHLQRNMIIYDDIIILNFLIVSQLNENYNLYYILLCKLFLIVCVFIEVLFKFS